MIRTDAILKMVSERHVQYKEIGLYTLDDSFAASLFPSLYPDHSEMNNISAQTRKEHLLNVAAIAISELEKMECDYEAALCFLKYLP